VAQLDSCARNARHFSAGRDAALRVWCLRTRRLLASQAAGATPELGALQASVYPPPYHEHTKYIWQRARLFPQGSFIVRRRGAAAGGERDGALIGYCAAYPWPRAAAHESPPMIGDAKGEAMAVTEDILATGFDEEEGMDADMVFAEGVMDGGIDGEEDVDMLEIDELDAEEDDYSEL
jgi:hypothetical protein